LEYYYDFEEQYLPFEEHYQRIQPNENKASSLVRASKTAVAIGNDEEKKITFKLEEADMEDEELADIEPQLSKQRIKKPVKASKRGFKRRFEEYTKTKQGMKEARWLSKKFKEVFPDKIGRYLHGLDGVTGDRMQKPSTEIEIQVQSEPKPITIPRKVRSTGNMIILEESDEKKSETPIAKPEVKAIRKPRKNQGKRIQLVESKEKTPNIPIVKPEAKKKQKAGNRITLVASGDKPPVIPITEPAIQHNRAQTIAKKFQQHIKNAKNPKELKRLTKEYNDKHRAQIRNIMSHFNTGNMKQKDKTQVQTESGSKAAAANGRVRHLGITKRDIQANEKEKGDDDVEEEIHDTFNPLQQQVDRAKESLFKTGKDLRNKLYNLYKYFRKQKKNDAKTTDGVDDSYQVEKELHKNLEPVQATIENITQSLVNIGGNLREKTFDTYELFEKEFEKRAKQQHSNLKDGDNKISNEQRNGKLQSSYKKKMAKLLRVLMQRMKKQKKHKKEPTPTPPVTITNNQHEKEMEEDQNEIEEMARHNGTNIEDYNEGENSVSTSRMKKDEKISKDIEVDTNVDQSNADSKIGDKTEPSVTQQDEKDDLVDKDNLDGGSKHSDLNGKNLNVKIDVMPPSDDDDDNDDDENFDTEINDDKPTIKDDDEDDSDGEAQELDLNRFDGFNKLADNEKLAVEEMAKEWSKARTKMKKRARKIKKNRKLSRDGKLPRTGIDGRKLIHSYNDGAPMLLGTEKPRVFDYGYDDAMDALTEGSSDREHYVDTTKDEVVNLESEEDRDLPDMTTDDEEGLILSHPFHGS